MVSVLESSSVLTIVSITGSLVGNRFSKGSQPIDIMEFSELAESLSVLLLVCFAGVPIIDTGAGEVLDGWIFLCGYVRSTECWCRRFLVEDRCVCYEDVTNCPS
jgi:hypothetical protein